MPEGNEVHRWAERHTAAFAGRKLNVLPGPTHRFADAHLVDGRTCTGVLAVGKHLAYQFATPRGKPEYLLHVHLGRFGDWTEGCGPLHEPKGALRAVLQREGAARRSRAVKGQPHNLRCQHDDGTQPFPGAEVEWAELRGPTDCSVYTPEKWATLLARIGPDPLAEPPTGRDDPALAIERIRTQKKAMSEILMDQSVLSGVGNIYRAELLFRHKVNPFTPGTEMDAKTLRAMWKDAIPLLKAGMVDRRIVCTRQKDRPSKQEPAPRNEEHYCYRRHGKPCFVCGTEILHRDLAGRTLYWCPQCQHTTDEQNGAAFDASRSLRSNRRERKPTRSSGL